MAVTVVLTKRAVKDLEHLPARISKRVRPALSSLEIDPLTRKKLQGPLAIYRSLRVGEYRILYQIITSPSQQVVIMTISPRGGAYHD